MLGLTPPGGDSVGIQTLNLLIRSQMLYSIELRNRSVVVRIKVLGGDSVGIQTLNLLIRSQMLYSIELRNRFLASFIRRVQRLSLIHISEPTRH